MNRILEVAVKNEVIESREARLGMNINSLSDQSMEVGGLSASHTRLCIHEIFENQARHTPDATAVMCEGDQLTYRDLESRANHLAAKLRSLGIGPDTMVGIVVERSLEMLIGIFGILKAGGAYVPIDPNCPGERIAFILSDANPSVVMTQEKFIGMLPNTKAEILCLDGFRNKEEAGAENLLVVNTPENVAYVIYTSGSTGKPKGVLVTHHNVVRLFESTRHWFDFNEKDVWTLFHSYAFDFSVWEIFGALLHGGKLVVVPYPISRSPEAFYKLLVNKQVTVLNQTPSAFRQLMQAEETLGQSGNLSLRWVIFGGEALELHSLKPWFDRHGDRVPQLVNMYGITETTVHVTYRPLGLQDVDRPSVIGVPIPDLQVHLLNQRLEPVAVGEEGEIFVGGEGVTKGYLNRPELTAARFVRDPFSNRPGARLYRSGDLARYLPDGDLEYLGRADLQIKIRGHRVELGEIEAVLNQHPKIRESAVLLWEESNEKQLVGYMVARGNEYPTVSELKSYLLTQIPDYMVPAAFVWLPAMPLNINGKLNRQVLPAPNRKRPDLDQPYVPPRTELEKYLAGLWCEILRLESVGIRDKFFELGGDSLLGAEFISRVEQKLGEQMYIVVLFEAPTIAEFAAYLEKRYSKAIGRHFGSIQEVASENLYESVDDSKLQLARSLIKPLLGQSTPGAKNPPALFVIAPPRSGTSLLRVMLAGSPDLFATSELQLLNFNDLQERRGFLTGKYGLWLEGLVRTIMEVKGISADQAVRTIEEYEERNLSTKEMYALLQEWIGPKLLVEKTPAYGLDLNVLERAEAEFENARYIHLVRHPYAMIRSFEKNHLDQVYFTYDHSFSGRELGELYWLIVNQNALKFLQQIPPSRQAQIRFEDLVSNPSEVMMGLCDKLDLRFHEEMLQPYSRPETKMLDGVHSQSKSMTDTKFFNYQTSESKVASETVKVEKDFLSDLSWELARQFNYFKEETGGREKEIPGVPPGNSLEEQRIRRKAFRNRLTKKRK